MPMIILVIIAAGHAEIKYINGNIKRIFFVKKRKYTPTSMPKISE